MLQPRHSWEETEDTGSWEMQVVEIELFQSSLLPLSEASSALLCCFSVTQVEEAIHIAMQCSYGTPQICRTGSGFCFVHQKKRNNSTDLLTIQLSFLLNPGNIKISSKLQQYWSNVITLFPFIHLYIFLSSCCECNTAGTLLRDWLFPTKHR